MMHVYVYYRYAQIINLSVFALYCVNQMHKLYFNHHVSLSTLLLQYQSDEVDKTS